MEIRKGLKSFLSSIEDDETKRQHVVAFRDFCLDLLEERCARISSEEEIDPQLVKRLPIRQ